MLIRLNRAVVLAFSVFCLSQMAPCSDSAAVLSSTVLEQAHASSQAALVQPLRQSGQLTILIGPKPVEATYTYTGTGSMWREEVALPGYSEVRLRTGAEEKIQRPLDREPLALHAAFEAMRGIKWLQLRSDERVTRLKSRKIAQLPAKCVEIEGKNTDRTVCVYDDGTLAALRSGTGLKIFRVLHFREHTSSRKNPRHR
jgi:hypothetical protein